MNKLCEENEDFKKLIHDVKIDFELKRIHKSEYAISENYIDSYISKKIRKIKIELFYLTEGAMRDIILSKIKKSVLNIEPSAEVFLFGSRARSDFTKFSDWDFLVLVDGEVNTARADRIRHSLYEIEWDTGEVISTIVKSRQLWNDPDYWIVPLYKSIEREGILL
jgi:predicted nucleotidyltransferase